MTPPRTGWFSRAWAILRLRCPRCLTGRVFRSLLRMNDPCPHCGHVFQREEGYFLGAMYISYALGCLIVGLAYFPLAWRWPEASSLVLCLGLFAAYLPLMPVVYRYSRILWMHLDYLVSPTDLDTDHFAQRRTAAQASQERQRP